MWETTAQMNCIETYVIAAIIGAAWSVIGGADRAVKWSTTFTYESSLLDFQLPTTTPATLSAPPCCGTLAAQHTQVCQHPCVRAHHVTSFYVPTELQCRRSKLLRDANVKLPRQCHFRLHTLTSWLKHVHT